MATLPTGRVPRGGDSSYLGVHHGRAIIWLERNLMQIVPRREALIVLAATASALGITTLPDTWAKPKVEAATLPRAAAASPVPTATSTLVPTATSTLVPTATNTPAPTATNTPAPTATPTPPTVAITSITPSSGGVVTSTTPTISGTATPGSTVNVTVDGSAQTPQTAAADGTWSVTVSPAINVGVLSHTATATATLSGQTSPPATRSFTVSIPD